MGIWGSTPWGTQKHTWEWPHQGVRKLGYCSPHQVRSLPALLISSVQAKPSPPATGQPSSRETQMFEIWIPGLYPLLLFSCSVMSNSLRSHGLQHTSFPCPSLSPSWLKLTSIESVMPSNHLILCHPLLFLPSLFPSIRVFFSNESALCIRWPKYWSFSFSISPSNEYSGLISFRINWFLN